jgi:hypothetical protein
MAAILGMFMLVATPPQSQAGVYEHINSCMRSVRNTIICIVLERGAEVVVEVTFKAIVHAAFGGTNKIEGDKVSPGKDDKDRIMRNGVPWEELKRFLVSNSNEFKEPVNEGQARKILSASCATKYTGLCALVDVPRSTDSPMTCSTSTTKSDCDTKITCTWAGTSCVSAGKGTKDLLKK